MLKKNFCFVDGFGFSVAARAFVMGLLQLRYEHDSSTIRLQHATTRYEVFRALAYEIVYENQW